eukprot:3730449-Prymnesium_polylepis.1
MDKHPEGVREVPRVDRDDRAEVSLPSNLVHVLSCSVPPHCAFTARRSLSHAACRGQPAVGSTAEQWPRMPGAALHSCWHERR